jgi:hypothetical protein
MDGWIDIGCRHVFLFVLFIIMIFMIVIMREPDAVNWIQCVVEELQLTVRKHAFIGFHGVLLWRKRWEKNETELHIAEQHLRKLPSLCA